MKKNILVCGGTGFIGYHLAKAAIKKGYQVSSLSLKKPLKKRSLKKVKYIFCNTLNYNLLKKKLNGKYDIIVNLSGHVNHFEKRKTFATHYNGCKNLAKIFTKKKIQSFVQIGSGMENGKSKSPQLEKTNLKPSSNYALAKFKASNYLLKLYKKKKFPVTILRVYQAYGPKQDNNRLIPFAISQSIYDKKFPCTHGTQKRDFIFIDDLIKAIFKTIKTKKAKGEIFNVGSSSPIKVKNVIKKIVEIVGKGKPEFGKIKKRKDEIAKMFPNIKKSKKLLKWKPLVSIDKGLKLTVKSYLNEFNHP